MPLAAAAGVAAAVVAFLPQALAYLALNGHVGPSRLVARKMSWTAPHALDVLASPAHGLFFWTPLAVVALVGLVVLAIRVPAADARARRRAAGGRGVPGVRGRQRRIVDGRRRLRAAALRVADAAPRPRHRGCPGGPSASGGGPRRRRPSLLAAAVWWNIALIVQFGAGLMDRQRLEPSRIAYNTFVVVPRALPGLAWRYLFDRASFYESARSLRGR